MDQGVSHLVFVHSVCDKVALVLGEGWPFYEASKKRLHYYYFLFILKPLLTDGQNATFIVPFLTLLFSSFAILPFNGDENLPKKKRKKGFDLGF